MFLEFYFREPESNLMDELPRIDELYQMDELPRADESYQMKNELRAALTKRSFIANPMP